MLVQTYIINVWRGYCICVLFVLEYAGTDVLVHPNV